jgi:selenocysteine lyase/cysteine desulfurase
VTGDKAASRRQFLAVVGTPLMMAGALSLARATAKGGQAMRGLIPSSDLMLEPGIVHLQTGTLGLMPRPVFDAAAAAAREVERDPLIAAYGPGKTRLDGVRRKAAELVGCKMEEIILTGSTTSGMNMVAEGLRLSSGDHVLTTDQEHHGGELCWRWLERRAGVKVEMVTVPPGESGPKAIVERFRQAITPATKVISFSHILYSTGLRMPVVELCALARERGCLAVIDGAQAVGAIPVDVKALGCHFYATTGHKWLNGPKGTGLLYINAEVDKEVDAMALQSGRQANSDATGVSNIAGLHGLGAAIDYAQAVGIDRIEQHNLALCRELRDGLSSLPQVEFAAPANGPLASQLVTFKVTGVDAKKLRGVLADNHRVHVRAVDQSGYTGLRASPHLFNSSSDVQALVRALKQELSQPV